jgi:hypothetical protein
MANAGGLDFYAEWNQDYVLTPNGSLQTAVGWDRTRQRIERKLITNSAQQLPDGTFTVADYVFEPTFGQGVGAMVDQNPTQAFTAEYIGKVNQAISQEFGTDPGEAPSIVFTRPDPSTWMVTIGVPLLNGTEGQIQVAQTSSSAASGAGSQM